MKITATTGIRYQAYSGPLFIIVPKIDRLNQNPPLFSINSVLMKYNAGNKVSRNVRNMDKLLQILMLFDSPFSNINTVIKRTASTEVTNASTIKYKAVSITAKLSIFI